MSNHPIVSVIMAVYNTEPEYLKEAISSILNQTFLDFEFIIVDDGSNTETKSYLDTFQDPRIRVIHNQQNMGLTKSLNAALKECRGTYIARMDSDDISLPERLARQTAYLDEHPEYAVIGARFRITGRKRTYPVHWNEDAELRRIHLVYYNDGICHPTAFFRKSFLDRYSIQYDEEIRKAQDYAMWVRITDLGGRIGLCPEVLFVYRVHAGQITSNFQNQMKYEQMTIRRQLDRLDPTLTDEQRELLYHFYRGEITGEEEQLFQTLKQLIRCNRQKEIYDPSRFADETRNIWKLAALKQIRKNHRFRMLMMEKDLQKLGEI